MEKNNIKHEPKYFTIWEKPFSEGNPSVKHNETSVFQYRYNGQYFEKDRKNRDWSRLPDLFSDKIPFEIDAKALSELPSKDVEEDEKPHVYDAEEHARIEAGADIVA
jgi:hypothetical protein